MLSKQFSLHCYIQFVTLISNHFSNFPDHIFIRSCVRFPQRSCSRRSLKRGAMVSLLLFEYALSLNSFYGESDQINIHNWRIKHLLSLGKKGEFHSVVLPKAMDLAWLSEHWILIPQRKSTTERWSGQSSSKWVRNTESLPWWNGHHSTLPSRIGGRSCQRPAGKNGGKMLYARLWRMQKLPARQCFKGSTYGNSHTWGKSCSV